MTQAFIVSPIDGLLLSLDQWKKLVSENDNLTITDAQYVAIVPDDGSSPFVFPKKAIGRMGWHEAMKAAKEYHFDIPGLENNVPNLPSRKQGIDIGDANYALLEEPEVHLDDILKEIGGEEFSGTSAWSCSRNGAGYAWCLYGSIGYAYGYSVYSSYRALPVVLYSASKASN